MEPFLEMYKLKQKAKDEELWRANQYTMIAVSVAVSRTLYGRKSKSKYLDKPILQMQEEKQKNDEKVLTEADKKHQRDQILMRLQLMQINFNSNKKKNEQDR